MVCRKKVLVAKVVIHADYTEDSHVGDIALLKLGKRNLKLFYIVNFAFFKDKLVDMTKFAPVCLPKKTDIFEGKEGWVYGE